MIGSDCLNHKALTILTSWIRRFICTLAQVKLCQVYHIQHTTRRWTLLWSVCSAKLVARENLFQAPHPHSLTMDDSHEALMLAGHSYSSSQRKTGLWFHSGATTYAWLPAHCRQSSSLPELGTQHWSSKQDGVNLLISVSRCCKCNSGLLLRTTTHTGARICHLPIATFLPLTLALALLQGLADVQPIHRPTESCSKQGF